MDNNAMSIKVKLDFESYDNAVKYFETLARQISSTSQVDLKINSQPYENGLQEISNMFNQITEQETNQLAKYEKELTRLSKFKKLSKSQTTEKNFIEQEVSLIKNKGIHIKNVKRNIEDACKAQEKLNIKTQNYEKLQSYSTKMVNGLNVASSVMSTLQIASDKNLTSLEKWSSGLDTVGNALIATANPYAMAGGVVLKGAGLITDYEAKKERKNKEKIDKSDDEMESLNKKINLLNQFGDKYDQLRKKVKKNGIANLDKKEQEEFYTMMSNIASIDPELKVDYDEQGRVITDISKSHAQINKLLIDRIEIQKKSWQEDQDKKIKKVKDEIGKINDLNGYDKHIIESNTYILEQMNKYDQNTVNLGGYYKSKEELQKETKDIEKRYNDRIKLKAKYEAKLKAINKETLGGFNNSQIKKQLTSYKKEYDKFLAQVQEKYNQAANKLQQFKALKDELNNTGSLSNDGVNLLLKENPDALAYLGDEKKLRIELQKIIDKQETAQAQAYVSKLEKNEYFFETCVKNSKGYIDIMNEHYDIDLANAKSLAEAKLMIEETLIGKLNNKWNKYFTTDGRTNGEWTKLRSENPELAMEMILEYDGEKADVYNEVNEVDKVAIKKAIEKLKEIIRNNTSSLETNNLDSGVDEFTKLHQEIERNDRALNKLSKLMNSLPKADSKKIDYLKQENILLEKQQQLYHESAENYRTKMKDSKQKLMNNNINFIGDDIDFESYSNKMEALKKKISKSTGNKRTSLINNYNELKDAFKTYVDSQNKHLPDLQKKWLNSVEVVKKNKMEIEQLPLLQYDQQLKKVKDSMTMLGDIDSNEEIIKSASLFSEQQEILCNKLSLAESLIKKYKDELSGLDEETEHGKLAGALLREEIDKLDGQKASIEIEITQNYNAQREKMINTVKEAESQIIQIIEKGIEEERKSKEEAHEEEIKRLEKEQEKYEELYNARLDALREHEDQLQQQEKMNELLEKKNKLQEQINKLSLDDSMEAKSKQNELSKELAEVEKNISKETHDYEIKQQEEQINKEKEAKMKSIEESIEAENERHDNNMELLDKRLEKDNLYIEARKIMIEKSATEISNMIIEYQNKWGDGFSVIGDTIKNDLILQLEQAANIMKSMEFNKNNPQIGEEILQSKEFSSHVIKKPGELANMSDQEYLDYLDNKLAWLLGDEKSKKIAFELNKKIRLEKGIKDSFNYMQLIKESFGKEVTRADIEEAISINNLIKVEGDINDGNFDRLQDAVDEALDKLKQTFNRDGIYRHCS
ncbi:MAG: hypothetical protein N4A50_06255 [Vallitalea sp.]|jgi:hypothetical protein|nr:hypothetical protein [Vallitalea sp.]